MIISFSTGLSSYVIDSYLELKYLYIVKQTLQYMLLVWVSILAGGVWAIKQQTYPHFC